MVCVLLQTFNAMNITEQENIFGWKKNFPATTKQSLIINPAPQPYTHWFRVRQKDLGQYLGMSLPLDACDLDHDPLLSSELNICMCTTFLSLSLSLSQSVTACHGEELLQASMDSCSSHTPITPSFWTSC